jgi:hypothetical protein
MLFLALFNGATSSPYAGPTAKPYASSNFGKSIEVRAYVSLKEITLVPRL